jgi:hypothetical protein
MARRAGAISVARVRSAATQRLFFDTSPPAGFCRAAVGPRTATLVEPADYGRWRKRRLPESDQTASKRKRLIPRELS